MCGFMAVDGTLLTKEEFEKEFSFIQYRGPDQSEVIKLDEAILGFHRLAIMGLHPEGMQPMTLDNNYVLCNGEIYNFRAVKKELEKQFTFKSESDCEILLPLYSLYKEDMVHHIEGEFALAIYDATNKTWFAARDQLGIRPLFYGYQENGKIAFASEMKAIHNICKEVHPFPIGSYYKDGEFVQFLDVTKVEEYQTNMDEIQKNIHDKLVAAIEKRLDSDAPVGFLLSGGLDSSLVCAIAQKQLDKPIKTFAVGMKSDAIDLHYARIVAEDIKSDHTEFFMTPTEVLDSIKEVIYHLETYDITTIRASIGMYILCKNIHEKTDIRVLLSGEVSDELFGYKYTDYAPSPEEFQEESAKRMRELYQYDVLRADRCIAAHSLEARVPFSDYDFANYVMSIDPKLKMNSYGIGKYLLRNAFTNEELLENIRMREKAAFSDAVGHSMVDIIKEYAEGLYTDEEFELLRKPFLDYNPPMTKEALLYRLTFVELYPNRENLITAYWLPNTSWPNCNVTDPSARVLPNYGDSGK
ncbi:asparagine synthase B [Tannockella kyphosi]|uniref:asparagine synthase B n=1 Tax=Tannockella kyphosi TaxID=2899121 RepID=UPI002012F48C|nr:asparagine synthase B [Tannockella kyphosi]